jgi:hypothetical protein
MHRPASPRLLLGAASLGAAALAAAALGAGYGAASVSSLPADAAARLHQDAQRIHAAVAHNSPAGAHAAAQTLRRDVARLVSAHELSASDGRVLVTDAADIDARARASLKPPAPTPAGTGPGAAAAPPPARGAAPAGDDDRGDDHGGHRDNNGRGGDGDDGGGGD